MTSTVCSRTTGSISKARAARSLRTTCLWTWLSGGTSTTASPSSVAVQDSRRSAARPCSARYPASTSPGALRWSGEDVMPCFANDPNAGTTAQRPQIPRPPQTESMSTPSERAASRTVVPAGARPRRPDGVKMICGSAVAAPSLTGGSSVARGDVGRWAPAGASDAGTSRPGTSTPGTSAEKTVTPGIPAGRRGSGSAAAAVRAPAARLAVGRPGRGTGGSSGRRPRRCPSARRWP